MTEDAVQKQLPETEPRGRNTKRKPSRRTTHETKHTHTQHTRQTNQSNCSTHTSFADFRFDAIFCPSSVCRHQGLNVRPKFRASTFSLVVHGCSGVACMSDCSNVCVQKTNTHWHCIRGYHNIGSGTQLFDLDACVPGAKLPFLT